MSVLAIRQGWTERIRYALTINGGTIIDLTGMTIRLVGKNKYSDDLSFSGTVGSDDPTAGVVYLDPATTDLLASSSPYRVRWSVTDTNGKTAYFPRTNTGPLIWNIENP